MKPWMIAALLGALFGLLSRRWLAVDVGRGQTYDGHGSVVYVVIGLGNRIYHNSSPVSSLPAKESSDAEGA
jgi:hypothetical protein